MLQNPLDIITLVMDEQEPATMLDHILRTAQAYETTHGRSPDVIYINPVHYACLCRQHHDLFNRDETVSLGFRLMIVPSCQLTHPQAAVLSTEDRPLGRVA